LWSDHLVVLFPIWFGTAPALLKAYFEQVLRPGFAVGKAEVGRPPGPKLLGGRSARLVVSMGMPALVYRLFFPQGLKLVRQNLLGFGGIAPVRATLIGTVETGGARLGQWIRKMEALGRAAR
jgi:putative NADPH-quinone reductase